MVEAVRHRRCAPWFGTLQAVMVPAMSEILGLIGCSLTMFARTQAWQAYALWLVPLAAGPFGVLYSHPGLDEDPGVAANTHLESPYSDQTLG